MGPQSPLLFVLLLVVFGGLVYWLARSRRVVWKVVAGVCAFAPPLVFGVAAVNRYYGYYESWGDVWQDLDQSAPAGALTVGDITRHTMLNRALAKAAKKPSTERSGLLFDARIPGRQSGISRRGLVWLPPQYFQPAYANLRFPVIELLHGGPGNPSDFTRRLEINQVLLNLMAVGRAKPAVLVMPDSNGGRNVALQCLDVAGGPHDETYLTGDVPRDIIDNLRVQPTGSGWGIAGYSEGGYCAANLSLRHPGDYSHVGIMSGYFEPLQYDKLPHRVDPFGGNRYLRDENTPVTALLAMSDAAKLPDYWIMTGGGSPHDLADTRAFVTLLHRFQPALNPVIVKGGRHDFTAWRQVVPDLLHWMTVRLPAPTPNQPTYAQPGPAVPAAHPTPTARATYAGHPL